MIVEVYSVRVIAFNGVGESKPLDSDEIICRIPKGKHHDGSLFSNKIIIYHMASCLRV